MLIKGLVTTTRNFGYILGIIHFRIIAPQLLKDVRAKIFQSQIFFNFLLQSDNELLVLEMRKMLGVAIFVSETERVKKLP